MDFRLARYDGDRYVEGAISFARTSCSQLLGMTLPGFGVEHRRLMDAHEVPGLFVAHPSAFPLPPSVDPSLGIMAWSYVAAGGIQGYLG
jgi:hypothetical protein